VTLNECTDGSPCYVARVIELPGCESHGTTQADALANLEDAKRLYIQSMIEDGIEPSDALAEELRSYARQRLASYKVPRVVDFRADFPRLPTGKLYKKPLREEYLARQP